MKVAIEVAAVSYLSAISVMRAANTPDYGAIADD